MRPEGSVKQKKIIRELPLYTRKMNQLCTRSVRLSESSRTQMSLHFFDFPPLVTNYRSILLFSLGEEENGKPAVQSFFVRPTARQPDAELREFSHRDLCMASDSGGQAAAKYA